MNIGFASAATFAEVELGVSAPLVLALLVSIVYCEMFLLS
jgi:hypothetical protein